MCKEHREKTWKLLETDENMFLKKRHKLRQLRSVNQRYLTSALAEHAVAGLMLDLTRVTGKKRQEALLSTLGLCHSMFIHNIIWPLRPELLITSISCKFTVCTTCKENYWQEVVLVCSIDTSKCRRFVFFWCFLTYLVQPWTHFSAPPLCVSAAHPQGTERSASEVPWHHSLWTWQKAPNPNATVEDKTIPSPAWQKIGPTTRFCRRTCQW